jgi:aldehyde:ferredoxin oxidoreductase
MKGWIGKLLRIDLTTKKVKEEQLSLDYENIGMLGSDLEIYNLPQVASLNYLLLNLSFWI